ncbi:MAG TPA: fibronectin type III domain-containing protein [Thermoanaerobaculia bacterium]|nr:fibronectin type III domain-containing protein [Thermoanaerobaculia bacterium]
MLTPTRALLLLLLSLTSLSLGAAGRELAQPFPAPTSYVTIAPQVAFAGGRFLTVWHEDMGYLGSPVMGAFSDVTGRGGSAQAFALALPVMTNPHSMRLIPSGDSYTLFWRDNVQGTLMAHIDLQGRVTSIHAVALPGHFLAAYAWNGTHFLAIVQRNATYQAVGAIFDREGRVVRGAIDIPYDTYAFDITVANGEFVAVTTGWDGIHVQTITTDAVQKHKTIERASGKTPDTYRVTHGVVTPKANGDVLVVWAGGANDEFAVKSITFRRDGTLSEPSVLATHRRVLMPLEVTRTSAGYLAAYVNIDGEQVSLWTVLMDASGARAAESLKLQTPFVLGASAAASNSIILVVHPKPVYPTGILATAIEENGEARAPEVLSIGWSRQTQPILSAGGGRVLAAWSEGDGDGYTVRVADTAAGTSAIVANGVLASREVSWNGTHHLVLHHDNTRVLATRIAPDGTVFDDQPIVIGNLGAGSSGPPASVVWTGDYWLVVWTDGERLRVVDVSRGGFASVPRTLDVHPLPAEWSRYIGPPVLGFDGTHALLVWHESQQPPCSMFPPCDGGETKSFATPLTRDGARAGNTFELPLQFFAPVSIASSGSELFVLSGTRAIVLDGDPSVLRVAATRDLFDWNVTGDVTWDGRDYVVTMRYRGAQWHLSLRRLDRALNDVTAPRGTPTLTPDVQEPPSVAAPFSGDALIGVQEGTIPTGVRATVYRESELALLPTPPAPPQNVRVRQAGRSGYEVTWDPSPSGDVELYLVEVQTPGGAWIEAARVGSDVRSVEVAWPAVRVRAFNAGGSSAPVSPPYPGKRRSVR